MKLRKSSRKTAEAPIETATRDVTVENPRVQGAAAPAKTDNVTKGSLYDSGRDADHRRSLIAEAAYFRAAKRGFKGGSPEHDWLEAEAELEEQLAKMDR